MKNQILKSIVAVSFVMLFAIVSASAQTSNQMVANIPFDFYVKSQKFTAGEYVVERANPNSFSASMIIRQKDGKNSNIVMMLPLTVNAGTGKNQPSLIFNRYGADYFLSEVRNPADSFGAQFPKVKLERNLAKQSGEAKRETIALSSDQR
jgi:hypothetical protein